MEFKILLGILCFASTYISSPHWDGLRITDAWYSLMATIKCKSANSPFSFEHSSSYVVVITICHIRLNRGLLLVFFGMLLITSPWLCHHGCTIYLARQKCHLGLNSPFLDYHRGYLYRNSSPHNVSQICGVKRTRPHGIGAEKNPPSEGRSCEIVFLKWTGITGRL